MFDQLDDPDGFEVDAEFFAGTSRRFGRQRQRRAALRIGGAAACVAIAVPGLLSLREGHRVIDSSPPDVPETGVGFATTSSTDSADVSTSAPSDTFPPASAAATNILIVGSDVSPCPNGGAPGTTPSGGRTDTIMLLRLDPPNKRAAVLTFPRDLWVDIPGMGQGRINAAFTTNDPQRLIDTLSQNFEVPVDHFIEVGFCAFTKLIDAIGGVDVPLPYAVRDDHTGLNAGPGCTSLSGETALAYVRSRHFQYQDSAGKWHEDPSADLGRIVRQQDLLRRTLSKAMAGGVLRPSVISALYATFSDDLVVDTGLTIDKMIELVGAIRDVTPRGIHGYQIAATGTMIAGSDVLVWKKDSPETQATLDIFRGVAPMKGALGNDGAGIVDTSPPASADTAPNPAVPSVPIAPDPDTEC
ncbi:MAG: LCP family protein [Ilumatobacteraceae bacterium]